MKILDKVTSWWKKKQAYVPPETRPGFRPEATPNPHKEKRVRLPSQARWNKAINSMNNWQRHQHKKAGFPGLREKDAQKLRPFQDLVHWKRGLQDDEAGMG